MNEQLAFGMLAVLFLGAGALGQGPKAAPADAYGERYRPQFHYTVKKGWINDPCGLVYYDGEYHMFNDHNPFGNRIPGPLGAKDRPPSRWSHAVSSDLVHWKQLPVAIMPDKLGAIFSGSGVVDRDNTAGFQSGEAKTLVLIYTSAGYPFKQSISYSTDRGRTWTPYKGNPVVPNQGLMGSERDPMVFRHGPTKKWVMVLYVKRGTARFFTSPDLKKWTRASDFRPGGFHECPDMFELPVAGDETSRKWVLLDAPFNYWVGRFDGKTFTPEAKCVRGDLGANFYAAQTWIDAAGRRVQVAWMRGGRYPGMGFTQQMSFPCVLTLRTGPRGIRLFRYPVKEIAKLRHKPLVLTDKVVKVGSNPLAGISGDLFDIDLAVEAGAESQFGIRLHGGAVAYAGGKLTSFGRSAPLAPKDGTIKLRILVDRTSIEVFANAGEVSMTSCILPRKQDTPLDLYTKGSDLRIRSLKVWKLRSAWPPASR